MTKDVSGDVRTNLDGASQFTVLLTALVPTSFQGTDASPQSTAKTCPSRTTEELLAVHSPEGREDGVLFTRPRQVHGG